MTPWGGVLLCLGIAVAVVTFEEIVRARAWRRAFRDAKQQHDELTRSARDGRKET